MNTVLFAQAAADVAQTAAQNVAQQTNWGHMFWEFLTSPAGLLGLGVFAAYLFLWKFLGWTIGVLRVGLGKLANVYLFSLAVLVGGVVCYSVGDSWKNGTDPWVNAMISGGLASAVWAVAFLILHRVVGDKNYDEDESPKPKKKG